jgi:hypothetical protein
MKQRDFKKSLLSNLIRDETEEEPAGFFRLRAGARGAIICHETGFPMKTGLLELLMGVETPIPPNMINAAAPGGAPPRRIKTVELIIFADFHGLDVNLIGSCLFLQRTLKKLLSGSHIIDKKIDCDIDSSRRISGKIRDKDKNCSPWRNKKNLSGYLHL